MTSIWEYFIDMREDVQRQLDTVLDNVPNRPRPILGSVGLEFWDLRNPLAMIRADMRDYEDLVDYRDGFYGDA